MDGLDGFICNNDILHRSWLPSLANLLIPFRIAHSANVDLLCVWHCFACLAVMYWQLSGRLFHQLEACANLCPPILTSGSPVPRNIYKHAGDWQLEVWEIVRVLFFFGQSLGTESPRHSSDGENNSPLLCLLTTGGQPVDIYRKNHRWLHRAQSIKSVASLQLIVHSTWDVLQNGALC